MVSPFNKRSPAGDNWKVQPLQPLWTGALRSLTCKNSPNWPLSQGPWAPTFKPLPTLPSPLPLPAPAANGIYRCEEESSPAPAGDGALWRQIGAGGAEISGRDTDARWGETLRIQHPAIWSRNFSPYRPSRNRTKQPESPIV